MFSLRELCIAMYHLIATRSPLQYISRQRPRKGHFATLLVNSLMHSDIFVLSLPLN